jgi:hypothetical protein
MTNKYLYITLLAILGFKTEAQAQADGSAPRLVVSIAIDQLRSDYLQAFAPLYLPDGFKRLLEKGLVYESASYPFTPVDRASAIASLSTGVTPYYNNIVGERWLNRETLRPVNSIDDASHAGLGTTETASPANLGTSAIGDELKVATGGKGKVFAIAPYRDAAVLSGGHAADGVFWIDDASGEWCSSDYYFDALPAWLQAYNKLSSPAKTAKDSVWEPINYLVGNFSYFMQTGQQKPFKHAFTGNRCFQEFKASALVNEAVTEMAKQCIANNVMGIDGVTDLLCLTYYAGNYDHRTVTECQIELQDTYVRLDQELSRLLNHIEQKVGTNRVLFVITSTGYSDVESADYEKYRIPTGTFYMNRTAGLLNMYLGAVWGQGKYVDTHFRNQIFLNHKLLETKKISIADATNRAQEFLAMLSGVRNVYTSLQLLTGNNEHLRKIRNAFNAEKSGDILIEPAPGWKLLNEDTQENELVRASHVPFPIIIFGAGTTAERIKTPVTTDRIAPTIARAIRIRAPNACSAEPLF